MRHGRRVGVRVILEQLVDSLLSGREVVGVLELVLRDLQQCVVRDTARRERVDDRLEVFHRLGVAVVLEKAHAAVVLTTGELLVTLLGTRRNAERGDDGKDDTESGESSHLIAAT